MGGTWEELRHPPPAFPKIGLVYWPCFVDSGARHGFHPCLLAAICSRETEFGTSEKLDVKGPGGRGDRDARGRWHGHGLMQIDDRWHADWLKRTTPEGVPLWKMAADNIDYAARVVLKPALKLLKDLRLAVAAYNCGAGGVLKALGQLQVAMKSPTQELQWAAADRFTTGRDYSGDVFRRFDSFLHVEISR